MPFLAQALFVLLLWTLAGAAAWALLLAVGARMGSVTASEWNQAPTQALPMAAPDHAVLRRGAVVTPRPGVGPHREAVSRLGRAAEPSPEHQVAALRN
jgi:hypothetical protein